MSAGWTLVVLPVPILAHETVTPAVSATMANRRAHLITPPHRHGRFLRTLARPHALHSLLAFLLLLQQLALAGHVAAITLGEDVLSLRRDRLAGDHLTADGGLDRHFIELARDDRLQLLDQFPALDLGLAAVRDQRQSIDRLTCHQHVELDQIALTETDQLVVHRRISLRARLQLA